MTKKHMIISGPSASGKDFLFKKMIEEGLIPLIKHTTRPPRNGETDGVEYNFISGELFHKKKKNNDFLSHESFIVNPDTGGTLEWFYGIDREGFNDSELSIMTPGELSQLKKIKDFERGNYFIVFLDIDSEFRAQRLIKRKDTNDSIDRRIKADDEDFKYFSNINNYDLKVTVPEFDYKEIKYIFDVFKEGILI